MPAFFGGYCSTHWKLAIEAFGVAQKALDEWREENAAAHETLTNERNEVDNNC